MWYGGALYYALRKSDGTFGVQQKFQGFRLSQAIDGWGNPVVDDFGFRVDAIVYDMNGDSLPDLVVAGAEKVSGSKVGTPLPLTIFFNEGTKESFAFSDENTATVKDVNGDEILYPNMMHAYEDMDGDGVRDLVAAVNKGGEILLWKNLGSDNQPLFDTAFALDYTVLESAPNNQSFMGVTDIDGDGDMDITVSGWYTGLYWYENLSGGTAVLGENHFSSNSVRIEQKSHFLDCQVASSIVGGEVKVVTMRGQELMTQNISQQSIEIPVNRVSSGIYFLVFEKDEQILSQKFHIR